MIRQQKTSTTRNKKSKTSQHSRIPRIPEAEYAKGHYLSESTLHAIWKDVYKLKLQGAKHYGKREHLIHQVPHHPGEFLISDSKSARQNLQSLVALASCLEGIQPMPGDMCDISNFGQAMMLDREDVLSVAKRAINDDLTYTDTDGQQKPLVQFYKKNSERSFGPFYGICVPLSVQGQKMFLELAGYTVLTNPSESPTNLETQCWKEYVSSHSPLKIAEHFGLSENRIHRILWRFRRKILNRYHMATSDSSAHNFHGNQKAALYVIDPENGDYVVTVFNNQREGKGYRDYRLPNRYAIMDFCHKCQHPEEGRD